MKNSPESLGSFGRNGMTLTGIVKDDELLARLIEPRMTQAKNVCILRIAQLEHEREKT